MESENINFLRHQAVLMKDLKGELKDKLERWIEPIPVLVFVCNRADAIRNHIEKLIKYRPSADQFPIHVSQDCDSEDVVKEVKKFGAQVHYMKHLSGEKANITVPLDQKKYVTYYRIARHYKLALQEIFDNLHHSSVIVTEV
ncbi:hypothetical protein L596_015123 [Steinernema carpocapsae]|uniref:Alpha-1,3-mannosyl-glycoprotein 2-beta-N-acetylglucosaminyltransferase n=1 Tax=Steinernema carpocapsae TaxID=34508 RepID=A0A4U5NEX4_STECR|nr:hypothetical protein L596_015123 [Steinernema carpocapsae]